MTPRTCLAPACLCLLLAACSADSDVQPMAGAPPDERAGTILTAAGQADNAPAAALASVRIDGVPHVRQKPDFCGEACVAMWLASLGHRHTQDDVFCAAGLDPALGRGCYTRDLVAAVVRLGFRRPQTWHEAVPGDKAAGERQFFALHQDLVRGVPSIVCMHYDERPGAAEHFRLVLGYDAESDEVIYHEPAVDRGAYRRMPRAKFLQLWPVSGGGKKTLLIRMPLVADKIVQPRRAAGFTDADYAQHVLALKKKLPPGFSLVVQKPFVVVGDEAQETVRRRAEGTVAWAVEKLKQDYFAKDPERILDIWLFRDKESYDRHTREIFDDRPTTPYGYYSARHGALIMNIATGGGTLVHEIVHPFMAANFPSCPSWFNEGLASLYEQANERDGHIIGMTNWRLRGLQEAIRKGRLPTFEKLCATTTREFYDDELGTNYAQARYLCYYLQEQGQLVKFYHAFVNNAEQDPTGYQTLKSILRADDMQAFQQKWEQYVLLLRFP